MDLSRLSDDDLLALSEKRLGDMSDEGLAMIAPAAPEKPSGMVKTGRGMMDVVQGAKQLGIMAAEKRGSVPAGAHDAYTAGVNRDIALYEKGRGPEAGFDWPRLGGNVVAGSAIPGGPGKSAIRTMGKAATQGAAVGGLMFAPEGVDSAQKALQVGGGLLGGPLGVAGMKLATMGGAKAITGLSNLVKRIGNRRNLSDKVQAEIHNNLTVTLKETGVDLEQLDAGLLKQIEDGVTAALKSGKPADTQAVIRSVVLRELGFVGDRAPTRAQLTRNAGQWTDERELAKLTEGREIGERYTRQNRQFRDNVDDMAGDIGGKADDDLAASIGVFDDIKGQWDSSQAAVGKAYKALETKARQTPTVLDDFTAKIDDLYAGGYGDGLVPQLKVALGRLKQFGGLNDKGIAQPISVKQAESLRKELGRLAAQTNDKTQATVLRELVDVLDDDVARSVGDDMFSAARALAKSRFDKFAAPVLKTIVGDKGNEATFLTRYIYNGKPADIQKLKATLDPQSWRDVKGRVFERVIGKAFPGGNRNAETALFSGKKLANEMMRMGPTRMKAVFTIEEINLMRKLAVAGEWMVSAPLNSNVNYSNTASAGVNFMKKVLAQASKTPSHMVTELAAGMPTVKASMQASRAAEAALSGKSSPLVDDAMRRMYEQMLQRRVMPIGSVAVPGLLSQQDPRK